MKLEITNPARSALDRILSDYGSLDHCRPALVECLGRMACDRYSLTPDQALWLIDVLAAAPDTTTSVMFDGLKTVTLVTPTSGTKIRCTPGEVVVDFGHGGGHSRTAAYGPLEGGAVRLWDDPDERGYCALI